MLSTVSSYEACLRNSEKVYWDLSEAVDEIDLDFSKRFMPDTLARVDQLEFLSEAEKLQLNQIVGHAYAHLFYFVEEFIIAEVHSLASEHVYGDRAALRALLRFCEEEVKHQKLFQAFKERFDAGFPVACKTIGDEAQVAEQVTAAGPLAVMLLTSMLEWITQKHYLMCFRDGGRDIDPSFSRLFHLHWLEEAQHAKLDSLEIDRIAQKMDAAARSEAVTVFISLCAAVDGLLQAQNKLVLESFELASGRVLTESESQQILDNQIGALRWTFLGCGLEHPVFLKIVEDIAPHRRDHVAALVADYGLQAAG